MMSMDVEIFGLSLAVVSDLSFFSNFGKFLISLFFTLSRILCLSRCYVNFYQLWKKSVENREKENFHE